MRTVNSDRAYEFIRKRILNGEYVPGSDLMTEQLSTEIGVSRTPIRDALRQLETDGLVSIRPRLGASVKTMDLKEFRETCEVRLALESHAAGLAARNHTEADLQEIGQAFEAMRKLTEKVVHSPKEEPILSDLRREDVRFHVAIITAARNDLLKKEILRLHLINRVVASPAPAGPDPVVDRKERDQRRLEVLASHEEILTAISRAEVAAAREAMERHIQDIIDNTMRMLARARRSAHGRELTEEEQSYTV